MIEAVNSVNKEIVWRPVEGNETTAFSPSTNSIAIKSSQLYDQNVVLHEFGHAFDWNMADRENGRLSDNIAFRRYVQEASKRLAKDDKFFESFRDATSRYARKRYMGGTARDLAGGKLDYIYGHEASYLEGRGLSREVFASLFSYRYHNDQEAYGIMKHFFPDMVSMFEILLKAATHA